MKDVSGFFKLRSIAFCCVFLFTSSAASARESWEIHYRELVQAIKADHDSRPYELFAGYPACTKVIDRYMDESAWLIEEAITILAAEYPEEAEPLTRLRAMDHTFPSSMIIEEQKNLGDLPKRPITHPRYRHTHNCFSEDTSIVSMDSLRKDRHPKETTVYEIDRGDHLLSNTSTIIADPRYQKTCWAQVTHLYAGLLRFEDRYQMLRYMTENGSEEELRVTPMHRFVVLDTAGVIDWKRAEEISTGDQLMLPPDPGTEMKRRLVEVCANEDRVVERRSGCRGHNGFTVYNFGIARTHAYYIGAPGAMILVHNPK